MPRRPMAEPGTVETIPRQPNQFAGAHCPAGTHSSMRSRWKNLVNIEDREMDTSEKLTKDITPSHHPVSLLREALQKAQGRGIKAAFVMLIDEEDGMWADACGHEARDLAWALQRQLHELMSE